MTILITKGESVKLAQELGQLSKLVVGLGWDVRPSNQETFDLDLSCVMIREDGKAARDADFIYYFNRESICRSIAHSGDNRTGEGEGDDEKLYLNLTSLPFDIAKLVITATIDDTNGKTTHQNFGQVENAYIRIINPDNGNEVRFNLSEESAVTKYTGVHFVEIYRYKGEWKFKAIGNGYNGGLKEFLSWYGLEGK